MATESAARSPVLTLAGVALIVPLAWAQETPAPTRPAGDPTAEAATRQEGEEPTALDDVTVTGTLIRGVAPTGTKPITIDDVDIRRLGATNTNQIFGHVPVVTNAYNTNTVNGTDAGIVGFRPNIRNLGAAGGNTTLVLIDGHNVVGNGILSTTPDSGVIPPGMLERVEILPDGGSSLYGADAVGGIVNFITRRKLDGTRFDSLYGFTRDGYETDSLNLTTGNSWADGSALLSLLRRSNTELSARGRDFPRQDLTPYGGSDFRATTCAVPNITASGTPYRYVNGSFVPGTERCDAMSNASVAPADKQDTAYVSLTQDLADDLRFDITGHYSDRETRATANPLSATSLAIPSTNFYFTPVGSETSQAATFSYEPAFGQTWQSSALKSAGVTPTVTLDLPGDWRIKTLYNYGRSDTTAIVPHQINTAEQNTAAAGTTAATALNPYDIAATDPAVLARVLNAENYSHNVQTLSAWRVQGDGPVLSLPGGAMRLAAGVEIQDQTSSPLFHSGSPALRDIRPTTPRRHDERSVDSVFAQVLVPVVGSANAIPFVQQLDLDLSARHDDYSDFGSTTNPRFALAWKALDSLAFRGNIGTSFNAPSLADSRAPAEAGFLPITPWAAPPNLFRPTIIIAGGNRDLKPQTADTWTFGLDWSPEFVTGLRAGLTYWDLTIDDIISVVPPGLIGNFFSPVYQPEYVMINPTQAELQARFDQAGVINQAALPPLYPPNPYYFADLRRSNFGTRKTSGVDFYTDWSSFVGWGLLFASVNGTYLLERETIDKATGTIDLRAANLSALQVVTTGGATWNRLTGSASVNYSRGYDVTSSTTQTEVDDYMPIHLALEYDVADLKWVGGTIVSLNVNNVFDENPPFLNAGALVGSTDGLGTANGQTLGRLVTLGARFSF